MEKRVYECDAAEKGKMTTLLETDSQERGSFVRQGYKIKEGKMVGGDEKKYYLLMSAEPDFFKGAEEKFKEVPSLKRSAKDIEAKILNVIAEEESTAEQGFGAIFG